MTVELLTGAHGEWVKGESRPHHWSAAANFICPQMLPRHRHDLDFETIVTILIAVVQREFDVKPLLLTRQKELTIAVAAILDGIYWK